MRSLSTFRTHFPTVRLDLGTYASIHLEERSGRHLRAPVDDFVAGTFTKSAISNEASAAQRMRQANRETHAHKGEQGKQQRANHLEGEHNIEQKYRVKNAYPFPLLDLSLGDFERSSFAILFTPENTGEIYFSHKLE